MRRQRGWLLLLVVVKSASAQGSGVSMRLDTENGGTEFRMGETISLKLTFATSSRDTWMVTITGRDRSVLGLQTDSFPTSPSEGTSDPIRYRFDQGVAYSGPGGMFLREGTTVADVDLNQWVRFERPGFYRVHALFHAYPQPFRQDGHSAVLESNEIGIEIVAADAAWQSRELGEAVAILNTVPVSPDSETFEKRMNAARRIWYLETPESIREAARLLGTLDEQVGQLLRQGLLAGRHRDEAIAALKQLLRSPDQPVTRLYLETLAELESLKHAPPDRNDALQTLRGELAEAIDKKRDRAKAISIKTLLDYMPQESAPSALRKETAKGFSQLPEGQQLELLDWQWGKIAGREMIPVLRRIYDAVPDTIYGAPPIAAIAVERLYELDPDQGRSLILDEIGRPSPRLPFKTLAILPDATLPAMDKLLLDHLEHNEGTGELIARYATASILEPVKDYYAKRDTMMRARTSSNVPDIASPACEPALIAYFLRVEPVFGEQVLRGVLAERSYPMGRCWMGVLGRTASYHAGPEWEKTAIAMLQDSPVVVKSDAVKALGKYGSASSEAAVWESFGYWHDWWKGRRAELNEENRQFEMVYVEAIAHANNWTVTPHDFEKVRELCITADCAQRAEEYRVNFPRVR